jgi:thioredoxin reductase
MSAAPDKLTPDVLIVGAGPAGLTAAAAIAPTINGEVLLLDREQNAGGIPRHSDHPGYGIRDLRRFLSGPEYARRLVQHAHAAGATIRTRAMVTGWDDTGAARVTTPDGLLTVQPRATILATGARERPRSARLVPGDRPQGVYTTGQLQNLVHIHHGVPGTRAVVVGGELVSWSAVVTLREAGCQTVLMTTRYTSPESYAAFNIVGRIGLHVPIAARTRVVGVRGKGRIHAVEIENIDTGDRRSIECDTVIFTGDWIPDNELARAADIELDPHTRGPRVDTGLRTSKPGVFAAGNVAHPVDTADIAALDGLHVAEQVRAWLHGKRPSEKTARILPATPLQWISPNLVRGEDTAPARHRLLTWTNELIRLPTVTVHQNGREVAHRHLPWPASPGRVFRIPSSLLDAIDSRDGDVTIGLR